MANNTIQSVVKAMDVLKLISKSERGCRLAEIAADLNMKTPATHHLVSTLVAGGFLKKYNNNLFIGDELKDLVRSSDVNTFQEQAAKEMQILYSKLPRCVVVLAELRGFNVELTRRISYDQPNVLQKVYGQSYHIYANAAGLLALGMASHDMREHMEEVQPFAEFGRHLWDSRNKLDEYLKKSCKNGYLICPFDKELSFRVAAPIFINGNFVAAAGVSIAVSQLDSKLEKDNIIKELLKTSKKISTITNI